MQPSQPPRQGHDGAEPLKQNLRHEALNPILLFFWILPTLRREHESSQPHLDWDTVAKRGPVAWV